MNVPNVIVLIGDCLRAASVGERTMPFTTETFDTQFSRCYSPGTWTLPSHASLYSRDSPIEHDVTRRGDALRSGQSRIPTTAQENGYRTALFSENPSFSALTGFGQGIDYVDDSINFKPFPSTFSARHHVEEITPRSAITLVREITSHPRRVRNAVNTLYGATTYLRDAPTDVHPHHGERVLSHLSSFVSRRRGDALFCLVNLLDTHNPHYTPPSPAARDLGVSVSAAESDALAAISNFDYLIPTDPSLPAEAQGVFETWEEIYDRMATIYRTQVRYLDHLVERWFDEQDDAFLDNSLVIVTGDHGQLFGEEGMVEHQTSLHPHAIHVPLFVKPPAAWTGGSFEADRPVSLVSLAAGLEGVVEGGISGTEAFAQRVTDAEDRVVVAADGPTVDISWLRDQYGRDADTLAVRKVGIVESDAMTVYECAWDDETITKAEYELRDGSRRRCSTSEVERGEAEYGDWLVDGEERSVDVRTTARLRELGYL